MQTMIVYVDDATYARKMLQPLLPANSATPTNPATHWVVVACTPHVSNDITKWVSAHALELWRLDWAQAVFNDITPLLQAAGDSVSTHVASQKQSLIEQTNSLGKQHLQAKVLDARRPKFGQDLEPVTATQTPDQNKVTGLATAIGLAGVLATDF
ncbi:MAG TPA: hypothetical protein PKC80_11820 [Burkholderiaceae bacterium]|nr:hypothetical protein [Burkholderiaceae bacterium]